MFGEHFHQYLAPYSRFCVRIDLSARADNSSSKSYVSADPFKIMFKCMSGYTTERGKFIMPVQEKLSYDNSFGRCESFGFRNDSYESKAMTRSDKYSISKPLIRYKSTKID